MRRHRHHVTALLFIGLLSACASTSGQRSDNLASQTLPTVTPDDSRTFSASPRTHTIPIPAAPTPTVPPSDGPVTPSMAKLRLGGERYAALGNPNAPITMVEFSDFG